MNPTRRPSAAPLKLIVAAAVATITLVACGGGGIATPSPEASAGPETPTPPPTLPPGVTVIPVAEGPNVLAATADAIWVEGHRANFVSRIDPAQDREVARLTEVSVHCNVAAGGGAVWATNAHTSAVTKVDAESGKVLGTMDVPDACGVAADEQDLWIVSPKLGQALRYDPATLEPKAAIELGPMTFLVAIGPDAIWVAGEASGGTLYRIDPATNAKVKEIPIATPFTTGLEVGFGSVWVPSRELAKIYRIDPSSNTIAATITVPTWIGGIAIGSSAVWASGWGNGTVYRIDPTTNEITGLIDTDFGNLGPPLEAFDSVWVGAMDRNVVLRIDPEAMGG